MSSTDGRHSEHVEVRSQRGLNGLFEGGLTVGAAAQVTVTGSVSGPVRIEEGGILTVIGVFGGNVERNEGMLIVSGVSTIEPRSRGDVGAYALGVGSLTAMGRRALLLQADGSEVMIEGPVEKMSVDASAEYCTWVPAENRFVVLPGDSGGRS